MDPKRQSPDDAKKQILENVGAFPLWKARMLKTRAPSLCYDVVNLPLVFRVAVIFEKLFKL